MKHPYEKVVVVGLGYIGLPTAATLASRGVEVHGVDVNSTVVDLINQAKVHIVEPELDGLVQKVVRDGKLKASLKPAQADAFVIAVPTPFEENFQPDLKYVKAAAQSIAPYLRKGNLVVLESTSPVGTTEAMSAWLSEIRKDLKFPHTAGDAADVRVAYCPERVLPGRIIQELIDNDRSIGGISPKCSEAAQKLYQIFVGGQCVITNARTAEMTKLTENAYRDLNIAFANELSMICEKLKIDVWELIENANRHPRVKILKPGPGVGGHCIAVDPWFIVATTPEEARLIRMARRVNDEKPSWVLSKVQAAAEKFKDPKIACFGLAFKADIDDLRESPALHIVEDLAKRGLGKILAVEPYVEKLPESLSAAERAGTVRLVEAETALAEADILVLLVDHRQFLQMPSHLRQGKVVIDTRGAWR